jgi:hypothetical protein
MTDVGCQTSEIGKNEKRADGGKKDVGGQETSLSSPLAYLCSTLPMRV